MRQLPSRLRLRTGWNARPVARFFSAPTDTTRNQETRPPITIFSGIQPTGIPHLGNYLGALRQWVNLQDNALRETRLIFSLVDLHAITVQQDAHQLRLWQRESLAMLLAIGLDPERCVMFHQSRVSAHAELMWILSCYSSTGHLERMTQWKDKTAQLRPNERRPRLGLFSYPVLQAADILAHRTTHVPVGEDQAQHLEFARELAESFNHVYGREVLIPPETIVSPARRIMSLTDPAKKMSKSDENASSRILLTDSESEIQRKITKAVTDSEGDVTLDLSHRPGLNNLMEIVAHCHLASTGEEVEPGAYEGLSLKTFKAEVASTVEQTLRPIRQRYEEVIQNPKYLEDVAEKGATRARLSASSTLQEVKETIGLL